MTTLLRKIQSRIILSAMTAASLLGCASAPTRPSHVARGDYEATREYISQLVRHRMKERRVEGLSIALVDDQRVVWAEGFGYADKERRIPATEETIYRVGSISKLFTAAAAMQLAERGRLDIDKPLQTYLPGFSIKSRFTDAPPVTIRSIMTHHSGLPGDIARGMWNANPEPFTQVVEKVREEYAAYPPNFVWAYSNVGATLLGHAIQNVSGEDFAAHLERNVLRPIGMAHSSFSVRPEGQRMSRAYHNGTAGDDPPLRDMPAGGLNASTADLSRFLQMVFAGGMAGARQVLKPESIAEMLRPQNANVELDANFKMGLGWILGGLGDINIENAGPVAHHGGATLMHNSQLIALPEHKLGVVVLSNTSHAKPVVDEVATEALKLALEAKTGIVQSARDKQGERGQALSDAELGSYPGTYVTMAGDVKVARSGDGLTAELFGRRFDLVSRGEGQLGVRYKLLGVLPVSLGALSEVGLSRARIGGRQALYATTGSQRMLVGEMVEPAPIPAIWKTRIGDYEVVNGEGDFTLPERVRLLERDGFLVLEAHVPKFMPMPFVLLANVIDDDALHILGLGRGKGETIRVAMHEGRECIVYSGYILCRKAS